MGRKKQITKNNAIHPSFLCVYQVCYVIIFLNEATKIHRPFHGVTPLSAYGRPLWTEPEGLIVLTLWRGCWQKLRIKAWWHHAFLQRTDETRCPGGWLVWPWGMRWDVGNRESAEEMEMFSFFFKVRTKLKIVPRVLIHADALSQVH